MFQLATTEILPSSDELAAFELEHFTHIVEYKIANEKSSEWTKIDLKLLPALINRL